MYSFSRSWLERQEKLNDPSPWQRPERIEPRNSYCSAWTEIISLKISSGLHPCEQLSSVPEESTKCYGVEKRETWGHVSANYSSIEKVRRKRKNPIWGLVIQARIVCAEVTTDQTRNSVLFFLPHRTLSIEKVFAKVAPTIKRTGKGPTTMLFWSFFVASRPEKERGEVQHLGMTCSTRWGGSTIYFRGLVAAVLTLAKPSFLFKNGQELSNASLAKEITAATRQREDVLEPPQRIEQVIPWCQTPPRGTKTALL